MKYLLIAMTFAFASCSIRTFYPTVGGVVGGAVGSLGGPVTAAAAAGAGVMVGEMAKGNEDLKKAKEEIKALSTGDVNKLVQMRLEEAKSGGFFDSVLDGVYSFIKLALLGLVLWNVVPIAITWISHKKLKAQNGNSTKA